MDRNIVLVGLMGAGKTSVGKLLSKKYMLDFLDIDEYIQKQKRMTISEIFKKFGEESFRQIECEAIKNIINTTGLVISTGGGAIEKQENLVNLKKKGVLIYLKTKPEILFERIKSETNRPLLMNENPLFTLKELLKKREKQYLKADIIIDTNDMSIMQIVNKIGELCKL